MRETVDPVGTDLASGDDQEAQGQEEGTVEAESGHCDGDPEQSKEWPKRNREPALTVVVIDGVSIEAHQLHTQDEENDPSTPKEPANAGGHKRHPEEVTDLGRESVAQKNQII